MTQPNEIHREIEDTPKQVEVYKEVERFKLGIWLAKTFSLFVLVVVGTVITAYVYTLITTKGHADLAAISGVLSGFFEVIKVVISP